MADVSITNKNCSDFLKKIHYGSVELLLIDHPCNWDFGFTSLDTVVAEAYGVLRNG